MREALRLTALGKRLTPGYLEFKEYGALNLGALTLALADGSYRQGTPNTFWITDPKRRLITALPFRDRVAQQAVGLVVGPIFDRAMLPRAFASRPGKGTHVAARQLQADLRRLERDGPVFVLKTDFKAYFASILRPKLWALIEKKISCRATLRVLEQMVPREGIGLAIGNLTSQILANYYCGATLDRFIHETLGESYWYRYMDDLVILGRDIAYLRKVMEAIEGYAGRELGLRFSRWSVQPAHRGITFLGYRIRSRHKLLRQASVTRARRKIKAYRKAGDTERLNQFVASWIGHARHADTHNLLRKLGVET